MDNSAQKNTYPIYVVLFGPQKRTGECFEYFATNSRDQRIVIQ